MSAPANLHASHASGRLASAWFALALGALGLSALFAVVLVVARTPFLGQGAGVFRTALVLHVNLAVTVWFLAMASGLWSLAAGKAGIMRWVVFGMALLGTLCMLVTPLLGEATPLLSNYIPLLDHPLFVLGLVFFGSGACLSGLLSFSGAGQHTMWSARLPVRLAVPALLVAMLVLSIDLSRSLSHGVDVGIDDVMWGAGHSLQFVHVLLLMSAWCALGHEALARMDGLGQRTTVLFYMTLIPAFTAPLIAWLHPAGSAVSRELFTGLMRWGLWPGAALLGLLLISGLLRLRRVRSWSEDERSLLLSLLLFGVGCVLGAATHGDSLTVPAHYHATVGAVTLAYLVWIRQWVPMPVSMLMHKLNKLPHFYGVGILVLVSGLAIGGALGIARKAPHADIGLDNVPYLVAMAMAAVGGFMALMAVIAAVLLGLRAIFRDNTFSGKPRKDVRLWAICATVLLVVFGGWLVDRFPTTSTQKDGSVDRRVSEELRAEIDLRFQQGVVMLHARQYEHALTAFYYVVQRSPNMPEAYVNLGYALLGLKRYQEAYDSFETATRLRSSQLNAYYGLAFALEGLGDLAGAVGAMQTYVHLVQPDDPYRAKAEAAIRTWRDAPGFKARQGR